jgi:tetratricopeptide (TPR) repeat protein
LIIGAAFGYYLVWSGHKEEGLEMLQSVVEMNDGFVAAHRSLAWAYIVAGINAEAKAEAKKLLELSTETTYVAAAACAFAKAGLEEEAVAILNKLLKEMNEHYVDPFNIATIYAALRDETNTFAWLDKAVTEKSAGTPYVRVLPMFNFIRDNPRFKDISRRMGF